MSAWIVSKRHIDVLVAGVLEAGGFRHRGKFITVIEDDGVYDGEAECMTANEVGRLLWSENHKSINARYNERTRTPNYLYAMPTQYADMVEEGGSILSEDGYWVHNTRKNLRVSPGVLAKQLACYDYQSCEHEGYYKSRAFSVVLSLSRALLGKVEGYDAAEWGV